VLHCSRALHVYMSDGNVDSRAWVSSPLQAHVMCVDRVKPPRNQLHVRTLFTSLYQIQSALMMSWPVASYIQSSSINSIPHHNLNQSVRDVSHPHQNPLVRISVTDKKHTEARIPTIARSTQGCTLSISGIQTPHIRLCMKREFDKKRYTM
jgi:hypothetical protein